MIEPPVTTTEIITDLLEENAALKEQIRKLKGEPRDTMQLRVEIALRSLVMAGPGDIADELNGEVSASTIRASLHRLVEAGRAVKHGRGMYRAA